ncbi:hypothetical protein [Streptomyces nodosus]
MDAQQRPPAQVRRLVRQGFVVGVSKVMVGLGVRLALTGNDV